ncbi:Hypothetical predicted protein [Paramuricea clavata]|uniref:Uncharacterized protein n=1 Tax=Paramuricea clavata TaxID=317549 RepID=A0A7D9EN32_PARCT|nr:Hypothetical predicted protein [Paramuricea clavata]
MEHVMIHIHKKNKKEPATNYRPISLLSIISKVLERCRVVVDGATSEWSQVTSGVPQGSILGPMLFLLFINHLPNIIPPSTSTGLYADDTKLYKTLRSRQDCDLLQDSLSHADDWSKQSNIDFNASKCKVLTISRRKSPIETKYYLGSTELVRVDSEVDLGITVTGKLSWNQHIIQIVSMAKKCWAYYGERAPALSTDRVARRTLYLSLVKSHMGYATEVWSPSLSTNKIPTKST